MSRARLGLGVAVAIATIGLPLVHGFGFMAGFNTRPPAELAARRTAPGPASLPGRLVLVVVDGLRADRLTGLGPVSARPEGATCTLEGVLPSFSRPSYVALSAGVPPTLSGVHTNDHEGPAGLESFWEVARRAGLPTRLAADGTDWWLALFPDAFESSLVRPKAEFAAAFSAAPLATNEVLLVHLVAADDDAHDLGIGPAYDARVAEAGAVVEALVARLDLARDTILITADHGHIDRGGHGGPEPEVMTIPLAAIGRGVGTTADCRGRLVDVPATLAALAGLPPPAVSVGRPLAILDDTITPRASLFVPPDVPAARAGSPLGLVVAVVLVVLALALASRLVAPPRRLGVAAAAGLAWPMTAIVVYVIAEPTLSLSAVWLEDPWTLRMVALFGVTSVAAALVVFLAVTRDTAGLLVVWCLGALLPLATAAGWHGSFVAGPELGDPHAAFGLIVGDLVAALGAAGGLVAYAVSSLLRGRAGGARAVSAS